MLTQKYLKEILNYDSVTGVFIRKKKTGGGSGEIGEKAGFFDSCSGYVYITICAKRYAAHRLAWFKRVWRNRYWEGYLCITIYQELKEND